MAQASPGITGVWLCRCGLKWSGTLLLVLMYGVVRQSWPSQHQVFATRPELDSLDHEGVFG